MRPLLQLVYPKSSNARRGETILDQDSQALLEVLEKIEAASKSKRSDMDRKKGWKTPSSESDCPRPIRTEKNTEQGEYTGKSRRAVKKGIHQEGHDTDRTAGVQKASGRERQQEERSNRERREKRSVVNLARKSGEAQTSTSRGRLTPNKECTENKNIISTCLYDASLLSYTCTHTNVDGILNKRTEFTSRVRPAFHVSRDARVSAYWKVTLIQTMCTVCINAFQRAC